jgi:acetolactate synthase small subunit
LVKIHAPEPRRDEIRTVADGFGARIVGSSPQTVVVEMTDTPDRLGEMIARVMAIGACETMRSGSLAMALGGPTRGANAGGPEDATRAWWSQADGISS